MTPFVRVFGIVLALVGCADKPQDQGGGGPAVGQVEGAFLKAARDNSVPVRFMIAAGYLESRLAGQNATANYLSVGNDNQPVPRGTVMTQTAFGVTYQTLGLDPAKADSQLLETQVGAYGKWLGGQLKAGGVTLNPDPKTQEDRFYWLENLALLHRKGLEQRREVQVIFAREMISLLNQGFVWQDPRNGQKLELQKEADPIDITRFDEDGKSWFRDNLSLSNAGSDFPEASFLPLATFPNAGGFTNKPTHVEVIHCPLTLSSCLELETRTQESDIHIAAHYIIPPIVAPGLDSGSVAPDPNLNHILQVAKHDAALILTDNKGDNVPIENAIIIMLVGNSGRLVGGSRTPADPTWFTDLQLRNMGQLVNDICTLLAQNDKTIKRDDCMSTNNDKGVVFRHQEKSEEYRWGDIADYDPNVFDAYIKNPGGLQAPVAFQFDQGIRQFAAGGDIPLTVLYGSAAREIIVERLRRCADNRVVWQIARDEPLDGSQARSTYVEHYYDSGPNTNGNQFFRARVYGKDGHLMGWAIDQVFLSAFQGGPALASDETCKVGA